MAGPSTASEVFPEAARRREQRSWYWYDWANSAFVTTTLTVLVSPYLTVVAKRAACPGQDTDLVCETDLSVLGIPVDPGSLALYTITLATLFSALALPVVGALVDRTGNKRTILAGMAWVGSLAAAGLVFVADQRWQLGVLLIVIADVALACSLVVSDSILVDISTPDERDAVSSRGWAFGYLGGGLLLAINLGVVSAHDALGLTTEWAVRLSLLTAGVWWAVFTVIPFLGLKDRPPLAVEDTRAGTAIGATFVQLWHTLRHLRGYPQTLLFLLAYLLFNDGVQTVIYASSVFGQEELKLPSSALITTILVVQFVGMAGALLFGRIAGRIGARRSVLITLVLWCVVVGAGYFIPEGNFGVFVALGAFIGLVLGGTQALARSLYSHLVPRGREAEYFSLYQATERGTSWFGTLMFGLVFQLTHSYRNAILALVVFFVVGGVLLAKVDVRKGIEDAGNQVPAVI